MRTVTVTGLALALAIGGLAAQSTRTQIYATALNEQGGPVRGLQTGDLVLRDGGQRQGVMDVEPAGEPLSVAVVLAGFTAADAESLTGAIGAVSRTLHASNSATKIGVVSAAGEIAMIADDQMDWKAAVTRAVASTTPFTDAITSGADALSIAPPDRRVVLGITQVAPSAALSGADRLASTLALQHVALWTVELGATGTPSWAPATDKALGSAVDVGGALRLPVKARADLTSTIASVADYLTAQYVVTYAWPDPMLSQFSLVTRHDAGKVLTPAWTR